MPLFLFVIFTFLVIFAPWLLSKPAPQKSWECRVHDETPLSGTAEKLWLHTCASLACMLDDDSPYFQAERFYSACQPGADVSRVCGDNGHDGI